MREKLALFFYYTNNSITHVSLNEACDLFFQLYNTLPDYIILTALEKIQLPSYSWKTFHYQHILPVTLHTWQEVGIPVAYGNILCVGRQVLTTVL